MSRMVHCVKLDKEAEGLEFAPYPGELGQKIFDSICKESWQGWLKHQTMLINERRLVAINPDDRKFLEEEMKRFLFGGDITQIEGYVPPES